MKTAVCKLPKLNAESFFLTHTIWDEEEVKISIFDSDCVWTGQLTKEDALEARNALGLSSKEYWDETRRALSTNHGSAKFQYFIADNCFKWVKLVVQDVEEKLEYGSIALETGVVSCTMERMIDCLIDTNIHLTTQVNMVESDKQRLSETLNRHCLEKKAMEESLYLNFIEILNSKKLKLAALQDSNRKTEVDASSSRAGSSRATASSPTAGSSRAKASSQKASSSQTKPKTWRKTSRPKPVKRVKETISESDSPEEQDFPFRQTRGMAKTRKTKQSPIIEKPIPVTEPTAVLDEYDGDTEIDEPSDIPVESKSSNQLTSNVKEETLAAKGPVEPSRSGVEIQMEAGCSKQPLEMSRSELREFNTQKLLDDLGI